MFLHRAEAEAELVELAGWFVLEQDVRDVHQPAEFRDVALVAEIEHHAPLAEAYRSPIEGRLVVALAAGDERRPSPCGGPVRWLDLQDVGAQIGKDSACEVAPGARQVQDPDTVERSRGSCRMAGHRRDRPLP